jgi:hypothetical protein
MINRQLGQLIDDIGDHFYQNHEIDLPRLLARVQKIIVSTRQKQNVLPAELTQAEGAPERLDKMLQAGYVRSEYSRISLERSMLTFCSYFSPSIRSVKLYLESDGLAETLINAHVKSKAPSPFNYSEYLSVLSMLWSKPELGTRLLEFLVTSELAATPAERQFPLHYVMTHAIHKAYLPWLQEWEPVLLDLARQRSVGYQGVELCMVRVAWESNLQETALTILDVSSHAPQGDDLVWLKANLNHTPDVRMQERCWSSMTETVVTAIAQYYIEYGETTLELGGNEIAPGERHSARSLGVLAALQHYISNDEITTSPRYNALLNHLVTLWPTRSINHLPEALPVELLQRSERYLEHSLEIDLGL